MIKEVKLILDDSVRNICYRPYPLHPRGCPNYGKKKTCPPQVPFMRDFIDLTKPVYAIWNVFDFYSHVQRMKNLHPDWSRRQLECCLYWQGTARKRLQEEIISFKLSLLNHPFSGAIAIIACPEAMGVNVTETMKSIGEILEWPPITKTYQVAIAGAKL